MQRVANLLIDVDLMVAILVLVAVTFARAKGNWRIWRLFWLGFFLGLLWEVFFFLNGPLFSQTPLYKIAVTFPLHWSLQPLAHAVWDGALFLAGLFIVQLVCSKPVFQRFRTSELLVLILWGNIQELTVELLASGTGLWSFTKSPFNPELFKFGFGAITLMPQMIWTVAPIAYYLLVLRIFRQAS